MSKLNKLDHKSTDNTAVSKFFHFIHVDRVRDATSQKINISLQFGFDSAPFVYIMQGNNKTFKNNMSSHLSCFAKGFQRCCETAAM